MKCWDESQRATRENTDLTRTFNHNRISSYLNFGLWNTRILAKLSGASLQAPCRTRRMKPAWSCYVSREQSCDVLHLAAVSALGASSRQASYSTTNPVSPQWHLLMFTMHLPDSLQPWVLTSALGNEPQKQFAPNYRILSKSNGSQKEKNKDKRVG